MKKTYLLTGWDSSPISTLPITYKLQHKSLTSGPGCSKLTTSLVNISLKFQMLISQICQYFLLKKWEKLLQWKSFSHFFQQKISLYLVIKS